MRVILPAAFLRQASSYIVLSVTFRIFLCEFRTFLAFPFALFKIFLYLCSRKSVRIRPKLAR